MIKLNLLIAFLLVVTIGVAKDIRITCQTTTTNDCASGYKFHLVGTNIDTKYCLPLNAVCNVNFDNTIATVPCSRDFKNSACSTGVCYYTCLLYTSRCV